MSLGDGTLGALEMEGRKRRVGREGRKRERERERERKGEERKRRSNITYMYMYIHTYSMIQAFHAIRSINYHTSICTTHLPYTCTIHVHAPP